MHKYESHILANFSPVKTGSAVDPKLKPPPCIQTKTGIFSFAVFVGVHTFKYKQSSLLPD
jgi:hypothetical protein